jgi:hypothetical protein
MYCARCGTNLPDGARFCFTCGTPQTPGSAAPGAAGPAPAPGAYFPPPPPPPGRGMGGCGIAAVVLAVIGVALAGLVVLAGVILYASFDARKTQALEMVRRAEGQERAAEARLRAEREKEDARRLEAAAAEAARPASVPVPPAQRKPPVEPAYRELKADGEGAWTWLEPQESPSARVFLDNGTGGALDVRIGGKGPVRVEASGRAVVRTGPGIFRFSASDEAGAVVDEIAVELESAGIYLYNPGARWDYEVRRATYSTTPFASGPSRERVLSGMVFFDAGNVHYPFEEFPDQIQIQTIGGFGSETRTALDHLTAVPASDRVVRTASGPSGKTLRVVVMPDGEFVVQDAASAAAATALLTFDNAFDSLLDLLADGVLLVKVAAGTTLNLRFAPGDWRLEVDDRAAGQHGQLDIRFGDGGRWLWSPGGRRAWVLHGWSEEFDKPLEVRGVDFLELPDGARDPEPGRTGPFAEEILRDLREVDSAASALGEADRGAAFRKLLLNRASTAPPEESNLFVVRGLFEESKGNDEGARFFYTAALFLGPSNADAYYYRGMLGVRPPADASPPADPAEALNVLQPRRESVQRGIDDLKLAARCRPALAEGLRETLKAAEKTLEDLDREIEKRNEEMRKQEEEEQKKNAQDPPEGE